MPGVSILKTPREGSFEIGASVSPDHRTASARGVSAIVAIMAWCEFEGQIHIDARFPDIQYDIRVEAPEGQTVWPLARRAFEETFGVRFKEGREATDVLVLQKAEGFPQGLTKVDSRIPEWRMVTTSDGSGYEVKAGTMKDLAGIVSKQVDLPVLDETGIAGFYRFTLAMDRNKPETLYPGIEKIGLKLVKAKRDLPVMRVVPAQPGSP